VNYGRHWRDTAPISAPPIYGQIQPNLPSNSIISSSSFGYTNSILPMYDRSGNYSTNNSLNVSQASMMSSHSNAGHTNFGYGPYGHTNPPPSNTYPRYMPNLNNSIGNYELNDVSIDQNLDSSYPYSGADNSMYNGYNNSNNSTNNNSNNNNMNNTLSGNGNGLHTSTPPNSYDPISKYYDYGSVSNGHSLASTPDSNHLLPDDGNVNPESDTPYNRIMTATSSHSMHHIKPTRMELPLPIHSHGNHISHAGNMYLRPPREEEEPQNSFDWNNVVS